MQHRSPAFRVTHRSSSPWTRLSVPAAREGRYTTGNNLVAVLARGVGCCLSAAIIGCASVSTPEQQHPHVGAISAGTGANVVATEEPLVDVTKAPRLAPNRNQVVYQPKIWGSARVSKARVVKPILRVERVVIGAPVTPLASHAMPSAPLEPSHTRDRIDAVEDISKALTANMVFHAPSSLMVRRTQRVQLTVDLPAARDELQRMIEAAEDHQPRIRLSDHIQARLAGPGLAITAITPEDQPIARRETIRWQWTVQPSVVGLHRLYLTIAAYTNIDGTPLPSTTIGTFDKVIEVKDWHQQAVDFVIENWPWLCAMILLSLPLWVWVRRRTLSLR